MAVLTSSVGQGGRNERKDVTTVQTLLKSKGGEPGPADGVCDAKTIAAIRKFQTSFMGQPDGLVSPGGPTWARLSGATAATPAKWSGDSAQWPQDKKLLSMNPLLRPKVQAVVAALSQSGFQPKVFYGWRSVAVQLQLFNAGNSKVRFSFHNAQKTDGTPNSYAADIIDARYSWSEQAQSSGFWKALGAEAKKQGLFWGGDWSSFRDWAHVQLVANGELSRVKKESGL
jgi:peptidoglycan hydrolase-like protein with peptidoglycan-binding domain